MEKDKSHGAGSGSETLFCVEARNTYTEPQTVGGIILTKEWKKLPFQPAGGGVPVQTLCPIKEERLRLMNFEAALALAMWFLALPEDGRPFGPALCIEVRLVAVDMEYRYSTKEVGVTPTISMSEMRKSLKLVKREGEGEPDGAPV